ncbi:MAG: zf-HC2 domain-containing protein, partial [Acidimicrobiia bacterium]
MTPHPTSETLGGYQEGALDPHTSLLVDAHLASCTECRDRFSVPADAAAKSWLQIRAVIHLPEPGLVERLLMRTGLSPALARMMADTPLLHRGWLIAVA